MNPINTSVAGTSVPPRSPRLPRSPMVQPRFSPRAGRSYQLNSQLYGKAENGQLTKKSPENKSKTKKKGGSGEDGTVNLRKKEVKSCMLM